MLDARTFVLYNSRQVANQYPLTTVRMLAVHCQGLTTLTGQELLATADDLYQIIQQPGCLQMVAAVAGARRDFMAIHEATDLMIERSEPPLFGDQLLLVR